MHESAPIPMGWDPAVSPAEALARWPEGEGLAVLWTGDQQPDSPGVTVLGRPGRVERIEAGADRAAICRAGPGTRQVEEARPEDGEKGGWGWMGFISYDAGRVLEPAVELGAGGRAREVRAAADRGGPVVCWQRIADAAVYDHARRAWSFVGSPPPLSSLGMANPSSRGSDASERGFELGPITSGLGRVEFGRRVARVVELIRAGDVYQVNLAHRLSGAFAGSPRAFFRRWVREARPWFGAYLETADGAVASMSPELFLRYDASTRTLTTRPMKGTRPAASAHELGTSAKDHAELAMIVDLMRNDLGRVSELGSVRVRRPWDLEMHAGGAIAQATATVEGTLRRDISVVEAVLSMFPAGSVTGAPKIRAMQIIDELEPTRRGVYCGAIGFVTDTGDAAFNVAIRTAVIAEGRLEYHVGAGIVADSDPAAEWNETMEKAGILRGLGASS